MDYSPAFPSLVVGNVPEALAFYERGLGVMALSCHNGPTGAIAYARVHVPLGKGGFNFALEEENVFQSQYFTANRASASGGTVMGSGIYFSIRVGEGLVVEVVEKMREAGSIVIQPATTIYVGTIQDRVGKVVDPFGLVWAFYGSGEPY